MRQPSGRTDGLPKEIPGYGSPEEVAGAVCASEEQAVRRAHGGVVHLAVPVIPDQLARNLRFNALQVMVDREEMIPGLGSVMVHPGGMLCRADPVVEQLPVQDPQRIS